jgi:hypothetical protein
MQLFENMVQLFESLTKEDNNKVLNAMQESFTQILSTPQKQLINS